MLIVDLWKDIGENSICISRKLGLYLKNSKKDDLYIDVKSLVEDYYMNNFQNDRNFRKKLIEYLDDKYYKNEIKKDISKFNSRQLISLITKKMIVLEIQISKETIIVDDEIFEKYDEESIVKALRCNPLINPIDEYDIEYKILFLFNFLRKNSDKRKDIDIIYYDGYSKDDLYNGDNIFDNLIVKCYKKEKNTNIGDINIMKTVIKNIKKKFHHF